MADFYIDQNSIQDFVDQNGVAVFVDQDGAFLGTGAVSGVTTTSMISSLNPSIVGNSVTFTATVVASSGGLPTGTVTFYDGVTSLGTDALNGAGQGTKITSALSSGSHSLTSSYGGDGSYDASYSSILTQVVNSVTPPPPPPTGTLIVFTTMM